MSSAPNSCENVMSCATVDSESTSSSMYGLKRTYSCSEESAMIEAITTVLVSDEMSASSPVSASRREHLRRKNRGAVV